MSRRKKSPPPASAPAPASWHLPDSLAAALAAAGIAAPTTLAESEANYANPQQYLGGFGGGFNSGSNYSAAQPSQKRGYLQWNTLDPRKETTKWDRMQLMADSRSLCVNTGLARVLVTLAKRVGAQRPQAASSDRDWNKAAEASFNQLAKSHLSSDTRRLFNFYRLQPLLEFLALRDGEVFLVLTESASKRARYAIYEAHRCTGCPAGEEGPEYRWFDGIQLDAEGGAINYWFVDPDNNAKGTKLSAYNVIHHAYRDGTAPHGLPALTHAIIHLKDIIETSGYTKAALKVAAMFGVLIQQDKDKEGPQRPMLGAQQNGDSPFQTTLGTNPTGQPAPGTPALPTDNLPRYETLFQSNGAGNTVTQLDPGNTAVTLHDDRPGPDQRQFRFDLLAEVAIGLGLPPNYLYYLDKQTGPMTEQARNQADLWIRDRQENLRAFVLDRYYAYSVAKDDKAGYLTGATIDINNRGRVVTTQANSATTNTATLQRPINWYAVNWQRPAGLASNHEGRNLVAELNQYHAGLTTLAAIFEPEGLYWEEQVDQRKLEAIYQLDATEEILAHAQTLPNTAAHLTFDKALALIRCNPAAVNLTDPTSTTPAAPAA